MAYMQTATPKRVTTMVLQKMKQEQKPISMLTAYDFTFARLVDQAGVDCILVGDSAANVMAGHQTTLPITLDQMIYHGASVVRAVQRALVVIDLPFGAYQGNSKTALDSSIRVMKETGGHAVKLEGGTEVVEAVARIVTAGIPVMGHLGLTPQSINQFGSYKVRAREDAEAHKLRTDAQALQEAGCFALVLEKVPAALATEIAAAVAIPVIGIGAGSGIDGQVLVLQDMLGMNKAFHPRFLRRYLDLEDLIQGAISHYVQDVQNRDFPSSEESY